MRSLYLTAMLAAVAVPALAQDDIRSEAVHFARGTSSTTINASITGRATIDYLVGARAGQQMTVSLTSPSDAVYFNLLPSGSNDVAFYVGEMDGTNRFNGPVPATGTMRIRVYFNRAEARRNRTASYALHIAIAPHPG